MTTVWVSYVPVIDRDPPVPPWLASSPSHHWNSKGRCQPRCDDDEMEEVWCSQFQKCYLLLIRAPWLCCASSEWLLSSDPWQQCADYKVMYHGVWAGGDFNVADPVRVTSKKTFFFLETKLLWNVTSTKLVYTLFQQNSYMYWRAAETKLLYHISVSFPDIYLKKYWLEILFSYTRKQQHSLNHHFWPEF